MVTLWPGVALRWLKYLWMWIRERTRHRMDRGVVADAGPGMPGLGSGRRLYAQHAAVTVFE